MTGIGERIAGAAGSGSELRVEDFTIASLVGTIAEPLLFFAAMGFGLGRFVDDIQGQPYAAFLAPGLVAATVMNAASFETTFGSFTRMTEQRTHGSDRQAPISVGEVVAGDICKAASKSLLGGAVILGIMLPLGLLEGPLALAVLPRWFHARCSGFMFGALGWLHRRRALLHVLQLLLHARHRCHVLF